MLYYSVLYSAEIDEPTVPRKRQRSKRNDDGDSASFNHEQPVAKYRAIYFQVIHVDTAILGIENRFNQTGYSVMSALEDVVLKATQGEPYQYLLTDDLIRQYCDDIDFSALTTQLAMLKTLTPCPMQSLSQLLKWFTSDATNTVSLLLTQVKKVIRLILVLPATNAISERSFSTLRRVKTYLRATMSQERLNALMKLTIYKEHTSSIDSNRIIKLYIKNSTRRAQRISVSSL